MAKLTYVHDPLCGWCYGFIPAIEAFAASHPDVEIEVVPGGLVTGAKVGPYAAMHDYITGAAPRMTAITGQALGEPFFEMMRQPETPLNISAPPSHAILQMKTKAGDRAVLEFAHALQTVHFAEGQDLNLPETYNAVCDNLSLPRLDTDAIASATETDQLVAESFDVARELGVSSFPTSVVYDDRGTRLGQIDGIYDPQAFRQQFDEIAS